MKMNKKKLLFATLAFAITFSFLTFRDAHAATLLDTLGLSGNGGTQDVATSIKILLVLTVLSLAPSIIIMMTSFTRIIIVLSFIRNALGLQQTPPNQVLIGLALILTFFVMTPVIKDIQKNAYEPYIANQITQGEALKAAEKPIREFMLKQTYTKDLNMFLSLRKQATPKSYDDISLDIIIPAFIISELKRAFQIGFFIFVPFIVIDMVVSSTLMSMGMMMLPPSMISLPFKIMLFVLVDGWNLVIKTLLVSFK